MLLHIRIKCFVDLDELIVTAFLVLLYLSCICRTAYLKSKKLAETGARIEKGEVVQPKQTMELNHGLWLATKGAGFGKMQWR